MPYREGRGYRAKVTVRGITKTKSFKRKREALAWEAKKRKELKKNGSLKKGLTLLDLCTKYLIYAERYTHDTYTEKESLCKRIMESWGTDAPVESVNPEMVQNYLDIQAQNRSANASNRDRKNLLALWNWGTKYLSFSFNPIIITTRYPHDRKTQYTPPTEDILRILAVAKGVDRVFLNCYLQTGARRSEIMRLQWEDVNFEKQTIRLGTRKTKDGSIKYRVLPMSRKLYAELKWHWDNRKFRREPQIFLDDHPGPNYGRPYKIRRRFLGSLCERASTEENKIKSFGFHALRRYVASILADRHKQSVATIQRILGHESTRTTEIYLEKLHTDLRDVMELLDESNGQNETKIIKNR